MSEALYVWLAILAITLATFVTRSTLLLVGQQWRFPPRVEAALRYAPGCALAAIVAPDLLLVQDALAVSLDNHRLVAAIAASGICALTRSAVGTILGGMLVFWGLRLLLA